MSCLPAPISLSCSSYYVWLFVCIGNRLCEELDTVLESREPTYEDVNEHLPYLTGVVKETLRLHPSVPKVC